MRTRIAFARVPNPDRPELVWEIRIEGHPTRLLRRAGDFPVPAETAHLEALPRYSAPAWIVGSDSAAPTTKSTRSESGPGSVSDSVTAISPTIVIGGALLAARKPRASAIISQWSRESAQSAGSHWSASWRVSSFAQVARSASQTEEPSRVSRR